MRRVIECLLFLVTIVLVICVVFWVPWQALYGAICLGAGFVFGNFYRARMERRRSKTLGVEVVRLRNFKTSIQGLCDKLK